MAESSPARIPLRTSLKGKFPFRLGTSSYIIPADIVPNVRHLAGVVDDIELILFESADFSNLPSPRVLGELAELAAANGLSYTVHLPLDIELGALDPAHREKSARVARRVIDLTRCLNPFAWVVHHTLPPGLDPVAQRNEWLQALDQSTRDMLASGVDPARFCVETLSFPYDWVWPVVEEHGLSVCLDIGHILLCRYDLSAYIRTYWSRTRVVHLHGIYDGQDHRDLGGLDIHIPRLLVSSCARDRQERVVTLEVFSEQDLARSLDVLEGVIA
jgi:sugar phosphate isomerase/epimerase